MDYLGTIKENIRKIAAEKKVTMKRVSEKAKLNQGYIANLMTDNSPNPTLKAVDSIADALGVELYDLLGIEERGGLERDDIFLAPLYDVKASAGNGIIPIDETIKDLIPVSRRFIRTMNLSKVDNLAILEVSGDSMEPTFRDGDLIYIDLGQQNPSNMGIFVINHDESLLIKRISPNIENGNYRVISDNKIYEPYTAERDSLFIVGRVIGAFSRY